MSILLVVLLAWPAVAAPRGQKDFSLSPMLGGYIFEGDQDLDDELTYSLGLGYHFTDTWSTEFVLNYVNTDLDRDSHGTDVDGMVYRLDTLYHFMPQSSLVPYLAGGIGGITLDREHGSSETDLLLNYGVGLKYFLNDSLALRGDLRHIHAFGDPENNFVYSAGLTYLFGGAREHSPQAATADSDHDGVIDPRDACPATPREAAVDADGCPLDSDEDGVRVPDDRDRCAGSSQGTLVDDHGCPPAAEAESASDVQGPCSGPPAEAPVDDKGSPIDDRDGDGVADGADRCPGTPAGLMVDTGGCPISLTLAVEFDVDKSDIKPRYHDELHRGAAFIHKYLDSRILIAGHTDWTASEAYNMALSRRRAESVRDYLVDNFGIQGERLEAMGYGETFPIADNTTAEGRQRNRRVELSIYAVTAE
jgi:OOP family OmpA-OmpF porin